MFTAFDVKWVPQSASLVVVGQYANNNGALSMYEMQRGELKTLYNLRLQHPIKCCTFGHHHTSSTSGASNVNTPSTVAIGDFVGNLQIYDV